jgi:hypothetical protein
MLERQRFDLRIEFGNEHIPVGYSNEDILEIKLGCVLFNQGDFPLLSSYDSAVFRRQKSYPDKVVVLAPRS